MGLVINGVCLLPDCRRVICAPDEKARHREKRCADLLDPHDYCAYCGRPESEDAIQRADAESRKALKVLGDLAEASVRRRHHNIEHELVNA